MTGELSYSKNVASQSFMSDGCPAYCPKLGEEEGALVTRLEDRYTDTSNQTVSVKAKATKRALFSDFCCTLGHNSGCS